MAIIAILLATALLGFLPLGIILVRRARARKIRATGIRTPARIYNVYQSGRASNYTITVSYTYYGIDQKQYYGSFSTRDSGKYMVNQVIDVYSDPSNPRYSTVDGAWNSPALIIFGVLIAASALYAVYNLYYDLQAGIM